MAGDVSETYRFGQREHFEGGKSLRRITVVGVGVAFASLLALSLAPTANAGLPGLPIVSNSQFVELIAPTPAWYTSQLHLQALDAATLGQGVALPADALPASAAVFTGIRPGMLIETPVGLCTANFVFGSPADYFIGTAGHCARTGDDVDGVSLTPGAPNPVLLNIGKTVKSVDNGIGNDFALIDVRREMEQFVNPSMAYWGGPTGVGDPQLLDPIVHTGYGAVVLSLVPREGIVTDRDGTAYYWVSASAPGDSGSAVRELSGPAAGNLTHLSINTAHPGLVAGTTIGRMLKIAGKPLATAPAVPDPL